MATTVMRVRIRWRWWVLPYAVLAHSFAIVMRPFVDEDDMMSLAHAAGTFIGKHGFYIEAA